MTPVLAVPPDLERAISAVDPRIDALGPEGRRVVGEVFRHRARSEMTAARAFSDLTRDLFSAIASPAARFLAAKAVADEMLHAEICRRVAARYLGSDVPLPEPRPFEPVRFGDCPEPVNRTLRAVLLSCINESIGSAMLSACLAATEPGGVHAALKLLLADEIDHARVGFVHLASGLVDDEHRAHVRNALPTLLCLTREAWYADDPGLPDSVPPGHGCLARGELKVVVEDAISNLVEPGLAAILEHRLTPAFR